MAYVPCSILTLLFVLSVLLSSPAHTVSIRDIQSNSNMVDNKQPESFIDFDGSVLIPGIGRVMVPKVHKGFNPFTYNPVTGTGGGAGTITAPIGDSIPSGGGATPSYIPGGDDTFVPNPSFEVPSGGSIPSASRP